MGLFFEIEIVPASVLYLVYVSVGLVGFGLGLLRWWLGAIWLIGPLLAVVVGYGVLQYDELNYFYDHVIRQAGHLYIAHNIIAPISAVALNLVGIGLGFIRRAKFHPNKNYANTESNGRI